MGELMDLLAAETNAPSWPNVLANTSTKEERKKVEVDLGRNCRFRPTMILQVRYFREREKWQIVKDRANDMIA